LHDSAGTAHGAPPATRPNPVGERVLYASQLLERAPSYGNPRDAE